MFMFGGSCMPVTLNAVCAWRRSQLLTQGVYLPSKTALQSWLYHPSVMYLVPGCTDKRAPCLCGLLDCFLVCCFGTTPWAAVMLSGVEGGVCFTLAGILRCECAAEICGGAC